VVSKDYTGNCILKIGVVVDIISGQNASMIWMTPPEEGLSSLRRHLYISLELSIWFFFA
jgi:hypothetical protein